jgi:hypothetical protein
MKAHRMLSGAAARHAAERPAPAVVPVTVGWTAAGLALGTTALLLSQLLPPSLVLLTTGCVLATAGFGTAAAVFLSGRRMGRDGTVGWDLASAMVFLGLAAVLLTDLGEALTALAALEKR